MLNLCCRKSFLLFWQVLLLMMMMVNSFRPSCRSHVYTSPIMCRRLLSGTNICCPQSSVLRSSTNDDNNEAIDPELDGFVWVDTSSPVSSIKEPSVPSTSRSERNKYIAIISAVFGSIFFVFQHGQPVNSVALLKAMEKDSMDVQVAMCNGKPTLVDFYADWCESCKVMAPTMRLLESQYKDRLNFITIDGASPRNADMVKLFGVDAIPHVAFLTNKAEVQTALVGAVPKQIMTEEVTALVKNAPLPYEGYDAFEDRSHYPLADVGRSCSL